MMENKPLQNRVALVTGCSRKIGIGFAITKRLAENGADLCVHAYRPYDVQQPWGAGPEGMDTLLEELAAYGGKVVHVQADFMQPEAPDEVMQAAVDAFGHIDMLIANHAYSTMGALEDLTAAEIDKHLLVNVRATMLLVKAFAAQHDGRPGGRVILMTSGQHLGPMPGELAYIASKGSLHPLGTSLSAHLVPRGITVNVVNPGATDTGYASPELYEAIVALEPLGRWGEPDDAARLIAWLCSDDARWITGQVINSNGGGP
ncbi:MAG: SDR family oxidoreductase [Anaerolineales bacterium]|nr:SDR family oxidoreductase [Anaerolineales bacterium]